MQLERAGWQVIWMVKNAKRRLPLLRVSNCGRIQYASGFRCFPRPAATGYASICLESRFTTRTTCSIGLHRLVHILFNDPELKEWSPKMTVDHIDRDPGNNASTNLRWATSSQQKLNQTNSNDIGPTPVRIRATNSEEAHDFNSVVEAAAFIGCSTNAIHHVLSCRQDTSFGWSFDYIADPDLPGEEWKAVDGSISQVSSLGRVNTRGTKRFLSARPDGYSMIYCGGKAKPMGRVVLSAFGYPRPSKLHTVDHIDRNRSNNALSNLRWVVGAEQYANRKTPTARQSYRIEARRVDSTEWITYESWPDARAAIGVSTSGLNSCTNPTNRQKTTPGHNGVRYEIRRIVDASQLDLDSEAWKDIDIANWNRGGKYYRLSDRSELESTSSDGESSSNATTRSGRVSPSLLLNP